MIRLTVGAGVAVLDAVVVGAGSVPLAAPLVVLLAAGSGNAVGSTRTRNRKPSRPANLARTTRLGLPSALMSCACARGILFTLST